MSQLIWDTINPDSTSGNQLAVYLNQCKDALISGCSGISRPSEIDPGGSWVDTSDEANGIWTMKMFTGSADVVLFSINLTTGKVILAGSEDSFEIAKTSEDAIGPRLAFQKRRDADGGQTKTGDSLGLVEFKGRTDAGVDEVVGTLEVLSAEDSKNISHGASLLLKLVKKGQSALATVLSIKEGLVGIGTQSPTHTLEVAKDFAVTQISDDAVGPIAIHHKQRLNNNGQTIDGDAIGTNVFTGMDETGAIVELANISVTADGNTKASDRGAIFKISAVQAGGTVPTEVFKVEKGVTFIGGIAQNLDTKATIALADVIGGGLFSIDEADYKVAEVSILVAGFDSVEGKMDQVIDLKCFYNEGDTSWSWIEEGSIVAGSKRAIDAVITDTAGLLEVKYNCNLDNFVEGKIYLTVRRHS